MSLLPALNPDRNDKFQQTIKRTTILAGIGMHSGKPAQVRVIPAPENFGIFFIKEDEEIKASPENVVDTKLGTSLRGIKVVEHFLAAAAGLGIDNLKVEVEGEELPFLDGSALPFVEALQNAGVVEQKAEKKYLEIKEKVEIKEEGKSIAASPYNGFKITFVVNYPTVGEQSFVFEWDTESFVREIAPARTFGYVENLKEMQSQGFALGASLENALAITREGYLNPPRFEDEVVRHKILDLIGDFALLGQPIKAEIVAKQSGHRLNVALIRRILEQ